jgi:hypothetical protein
LFGGDLTNHGTRFVAMSEHRERITGTVLSPRRGDRIPSPPKAAG